MQSVSPLLRLSGCLLVLSAAASANTLRRPHTGFLGMRGKRAAPPLGLQLPAELLQQLPDQLPPPQQQLPVQMPLPQQQLPVQTPLAQQLRQLFRAVGLYRGPFVGRLADKRTPSGFAGMRGRKRQEEAQGQEDVMDKRVPSGFGGLRGKKADMLEDVEENRTTQDSFFSLGGRREEQS